MGSQRKVIWIQQESSCSYKPGELQQIFLLQSLAPAAKRFDLYNEFIPKGFQFYQHNTLYATNCTDCGACVPLRIDATKYSPSRNDRRLFKNNQDLKVNFRHDWQLTYLLQEHIALFRKHGKARHPNEKITHALQDEIRKNLEGFSGLMEVRDRKNKLVAAYVYDRLDGALNLHYGFFDPEKSNSRTSLGKFALLKIIENARDNGLKHVYIGYWVDGHQKYDYKSRLPNTEALTDKGWVAFNPSIHKSGPDVKKSIPPSFSYQTITGP